MVTPDTITLDELLKIPSEQPEKLFHKDAVSDEYKILLKRVHPDVNPGNPKLASNALIHLNHLYQIACDRVKLGIWDQDGLRVVTAKDGKKYEIKYRTKSTFELGEMLVGDTILVYLIDAANRDLYENALRAMKNFKFADKKMREGIELYLPKVKATFETTDGRLVVVIDKTPDLLLLSDVLKHFNGKMDVKHVAWILSNLFNLSCWLQWAKLSHNDIALNTVFISPLYHSFAILGGWWYTRSRGDKMIALPSRTANVVPYEVVRSKIADGRIDPALIRLLGRELLGDTLGTPLATLPKPLTNFLRLAVTGTDAVGDYAAWGRVRDTSLGPRKFTKLELTANDLYN